MEPRDGDTIVVWFSCGAASAVAAKKTLELYGNRCNVIVCNNPIAEEDEDNRRFLSDVEQWLGVQIQSVTHPAFPDSSCVEVWDKFSYMSGNNGARCTYILKKKAREHWEKNNHYDWVVLGFTSDESDRHDRFKETQRDNILPVLIESNISKQDCFNYLLEQGLTLPRMYHLGYPNANCIGCVKATSPTYWNHVRKVHPEVFRQRAEQSRRIGCTLVRHKGTKIYLDELPEDAIGYKMKEYEFECGIFCEDKA
jgi:3'-phosphoadenosine 5'-phosphosulfate sulfotransferase (PAPS reductase)/FAD synthetase